MPTNSVTEIAPYRAAAVLPAEMLKVLKQFVLDHEMSGFYCAGLNATYFDAQRVIKKAEGR